MFSSLLWFGLIALFFFMMMRGGCGGHVMGHGHHDDGRDHGSPPPGGGPIGHADETAIDPVCGMQVATATAKSSVYRGIAYYFCSAEHRDAFEANPAAYLGQTPPASGHEEAHTHG